MLEPCIGAVDFLTIVQRNGLKGYQLFNYMLQDCNVIFESHCHEQKVIARGTIPVDLATDMYYKLYDYPKAEATIVFVDRYSDLDDPLLSFTHPSLNDEAEIVSEARELGIGRDAFLKEKKKTLLREDRDNCYIPCVTFLTPEALELGIATIKDYYNRKKENKREL